MSDHSKDRDKAADTHLAHDHEPVQLDLYGVKVRITPSRVPQDLPDPGSWKEVARRVHQDLKAIAGGIVRLIRVTLESTTNLIAGIGSLPDTVKKRRIEEAHAKSDTLERTRQVSGEGKLTSSAEIALAAERVRRILARKAVEGNAAGIAVDNQDGFILLYALKPGGEESVPQLVNAAQRSLQGYGGLVSHGSGNPAIYGYSSEIGDDLRSVQLRLRSSCPELANALGGVRMLLYGDRLLIQGGKEQVTIVADLLGTHRVSQLFKEALRATFHYDILWGYDIS